MCDRFDFEQKLIKFSGIIDDLRTIADKKYDQRLNTLADYYNYQFYELWEMFEKLIKEGIIK
jgi:hypothetical protein